MAANAKQPKCFLSLLFFFQQASSKLCESITMALTQNSIHSDQCMTPLLFHNFSLTRSTQNYGLVWDTIFILYVHAQKCHDSRDKFLNCSVWVLLQHCANSLFDFCSVNCGLLNICIITMAIAISTLIPQQKKTFAGLIQCML